MAFPLISMIKVVPIFIVDSIDNRLLQPCCFFFIHVLKPSVMHSGLKVNSNLLNLIAVIYLDIYITAEVFHIKEYESVRKPHRICNSIYSFHNSQFSMLVQTSEMQVNLRFLSECSQASTKLIFNSPPPSSYASATH